VLRQIDLIQKIDVGHSELGSIPDRYPQSQPTMGRGHDGRRLRWLANSNREASLRPDAERWTL